MIEDPIIKNIHRIRIEYAERYGNDLHRIFEAARKNKGLMEGLLFLQPLNPCSIST